MDPVKAIREKLSKITSEEDNLENDINEARNRSLPELEELLNQFNELDENFTTLLLSDRAEQSIETAESIVEWEEDVAEFLNSISEDTSDIKKALKMGDEEKFREAAESLKQDLIQLKSRREQYSLDEVDQAVLLLVDSEEIAEEVEWYKNALQRLERDGKFLRNLSDAGEIELDFEEIERLENNIPRIESQISRLEELVEKHNEIESKSSDFSLDMNIAQVSASTFDADKEQRKSLEEIESLLEELEQLSRGYEDTSSRRKIIKSIVALLSAVGGLGELRGRRVRLSRFRGTLGDEENYEARQDKTGDAKGLKATGEKSIGNLKVTYEVWEGPKEITNSVEFRNTSDTITKVKTKFRPENLNLRTSNLEKFRNDDVLKFHITPGDAKIWNSTLTRNSDIESISLYVESIDKDGSSEEEEIQMSM